jgi:hypothetical protein
MLFLVLCTFSEDEQVWIEQLFNENHTLLYKVSYQLLQSETDAEDAVAQAFLNIMEHFEKISQLPRRDQIPYSVIIAKNASYDILRKKKLNINDMYDKKGTFKGINWAAIIAILIGSVCSLFIMELSWYISLIPSGVAYYFLMKVMPSSKPFCKGTIFEK